MNWEAIESLRLFLDYGAVGLAGLMLLLVIVTLLSATMTPAKERILKRFMLIGAFCFAIAIAAQVFLETRAKPAPSEHLLTLEVIPHDSGEEQLFPPPIIKMGGARIDRERPMRIKSNATLIVDLFDGVDLLKAKERQVEAARVAIEEQNESLVQAQMQTRAITAEIDELKAVTANVPGILPRIDGINRDLRMIDRGISGSIKVIP